MKPTVKNMFFAFLKIGALLLGGGYVIVPLLDAELNEKRGWLTKEEIIDFYALGQCIPGIIAVNTTFFAGYKLLGMKGAFAAFFGLILPPFTAIIFLASILLRLAQNAVVNDIFWGVNIAIIVLIYMTIKEVWGTSITDKFTFLLFGVMLALAMLKVSPSIIIVSSAVIGIIYKTLTKGAKC